MKKGLHPEYKESNIACACGNIIKTKSTGSNLKVEICSACHPYFTGVQKIIDTEGRVEKFRKKFAKK